MTAGKMRDRISFGNPVRTQRADGGYDTVVSRIATVWADVQAVQGREGEKASRLFGDTTYIASIYAGDRPAAFTTAFLVRWETAPGGPLDFDVTGIRLAKSRQPMLDIVLEAAVLGDAGALDAGESALLWDGAPLLWTDGLEWSGSEPAGNTLLWGDSLQWNGTAIDWGSTAP